MSISISCDEMKENESKYSSIVDSQNISQLNERRSLERNWISYLLGHKQLPFLTISCKGRPLTLLLTEGLSSAIVWLDDRGFISSALQAKYREMAAFPLCQNEATYLPQNIRVVEYWPIKYGKPLTQDKMKTLKHDKSMKENDQYMLQYT